MIAVGRHSRIAFLLLSAATGRVRARPVARAYSDLTWREAYPGETEERTVVLGCDIPDKGNTLVFTGRNATHVRDYSGNWVANGGWLCEWEVRTQRSIKFCSNSAGDEMCASVIATSAGTDLEDKLWSYVGNASISCYDYGILSEFWEGDVSGDDIRDTCSRRRMSVPGKLRTLPGGDDDWRKPLEAAAWEEGWFDCRGAGMAQAVNDSHAWLESGFTFEAADCDPVVMRVRELFRCDDLKGDSSNFTSVLERGVFPGMPCGDYNAVADYMNGEWEEDGDRAHGRSLSTQCDSKPPEYTDTCSAGTRVSLIDIDFNTDIEMGGTPAAMHVHIHNVCDVRMSGLSRAQMDVKACGPAFATDSRWYRAIVEGDPSGGVDDDDTFYAHDYFTMKYQGRSTSVTPYAHVRGMMESNYDAFGQKVRKNKNTGDCVTSGTSTIRVTATGSGMKDCSVEFTGTQEVNWNTQSSRRDLCGCTR